MENILQQIELIKDRYAIEQIRYKWGEALDHKNWELFDSLFADDIDTDFTAWGFPVQSIKKTDLVNIFRYGPFKNEQLKTQHIYTNFRIEIKEDKATSVCNFIGQHFIENFEGGNEYCLHGAYTDGLVKTNEEWKINNLKLSIFFQTGNVKILE
jgi:SnoaL-like domain